MRNWRIWPLAKVFLIVAATTIVVPTHATANETPSIVVGSNVQVSSDQSSIPHTEMLISADPTNSRHLIVCSMRQSEDWYGFSVVAYSSQDAGQHWKESLDVPSSGDPACAFGPDGSVYVSALVPSHSEGMSRMYLYHSRDSGLSSSPPLKLPWLDREFIIFDQSDQEQNGSIYITGSGSVMAVGSGKMDGPALLRSSDGGATFGLVQQFVSLPPAGPTASQAVVLSDGSLVWALGQLIDEQVKYPREGLPNGKLWAFRSTDRGGSFDRGTTVGDLWFNHAQRGTLLSLTVDRASRYFKDRLYLVWGDEREGHSAIHLVFSSDKGKTWSEPQLINDDRGTMENTHPVNHTMPAIAVNRDGVVGVSWYDRRDFPDDSGWVVRFRASLDGGETWLPSVQVSEHPNVYSANSAFPIAVFARSGRSAGALQSPANVSIHARAHVILGGDTAGLTADADGTFHPVWADNRTGVAQVWTAPVTVHGLGVKNGTSNLAMLDDISQQIALEVNLTQPSYDRKANTITLVARLRNTSEATLEGPIKARVVGLRSEVGIPRIVNADNGVDGAGAVWDFTAMLPNGRLARDEVSKPRQLIFALSDLRPFRQGQDYVVNEISRFRWGLISLDVRFLGGSSSTITGERAPALTQRINSH